MFLLCFTFLFTLSQRSLANPARQSLVSCVSGLTNYVEASTACQHPNCVRLSPFQLPCKPCPSPLPLPRRYNFVQLLFSCYLDYDTKTGIISTGLLNNKKRTSKIYRILCAREESNDFFFLFRFFFNRAHALHMHMHWPRLDTSAPRIVSFTLG